MSASLTSEQAKALLRGDPSNYDTPEALRRLAAHVDANAPGRLTVLYSGPSAEGIWSSDVIKAMREADEDVRLIDKSEAAEFLKSRDFLFSTAKAHGVSFFELTDGNYRGPATDWLYHPTDGPWADASARFADATVGEVRAIVSGAQPSRTFAAVEVPHILANPNVTTVEGIPRQVLAARQAGHGPQAAFEMIVARAYENVGTLNVAVNYAGTPLRGNTDLLQLDSRGYFLGTDIQGRRPDFTAVTRPLADGMSPPSEFVLNGQQHLQHWEAQLGHDMRARSTRIRAGTALGAAGLALDAYDATNTSREYSRLQDQGNASAAQSGLVHFGARSVGGWTGAGLGMATGAMLGVETGPGLLITGAIGGVAGAVAGDQFAAWTDNRRIYRQDDGRGHTWSYDPDRPEQGWQRPVTMDTRDDGILNPGRRMLAASPDLANQLDYQATTMSAELLLGSPPPQQSPWRQPADKQRDGHSYAVVDNWVRGNDAQWQRVVVTGYVERVRQTRTDTAGPERTTELEQAMQQSLLHNVANSPMAIAARYEELHAAKGWAAYGPVPPAVQQARADLNTLIASDGNRYQRHADGQWVNDGVIYDAHAQGALRSELEATHEMLRASIAPPTHTLRPAPAPLTADERLRDAVKGAYERAGVRLDGEQLQTRFEAVQTTHRTQGLEGASGIALQLQRDVQRRYSADSGITTLRHDGYGTYTPAAQTSATDVERAAADKQREQQRDAFATRHPLFDQALQHLQRLGPQAAGYQDREQMENLAGALSLEARRYQLTRIEDVYLATNDKLVAVGNDRFGHELFPGVEPRLATQQPLEHSLQQLDAFNQKQEQEQMARVQEQIVQRAGRSM